MNKMLLLAVLPLSLTLGACGEDPKPATTPAGSPATGDNHAGHTHAAGVDQTTPMAAIKSFAAALKANDKAALKELVDPEGDKELRNLASGDAREKDLKEFTDAFNGATYGEAKIEGDSASVEMSFGGRKETVGMKKKGGHWVVSSI